MLIPGNYSDIRSAIHMDTPIQLGTGVDGKVYYSVLLESETDPAGEWSDGKALTFADGFREIGSEVIVPVGPYLGLAGASDYVDAGTMAQAPDTTAATYEAWIKTTAKHSQTIVIRSSAARRDAKSRNRP